MLNSSLCLYCCCDRAGWGVEHTEGKGGERAVAILRFQGGRPPPVSFKDHVVLAPIDKF
jgi:hypothetical protein